MSLSPEQIVAEEFRLRARGYDRDEVDAFLDRLADQVEADAARLRSAEERAAALEAELGAVRERESTLTRTLATVQDAADRARADADAEVAALRTATERELAAAREQAEHDAQRIRSDAEGEAAELRDRLREVQELDASHRAELQSRLQQQLEALRALPDPYGDLRQRVSRTEDTPGAPPAERATEPAPPGLGAAPVEGGDVVAGDGPVDGPAGDPVGGPEDAPDAGHQEVPDACQVEEPDGGPEDVPGGGHEAAPDLPPAEPAGEGDHPEADVTEQPVAEAPVDPWQRRRDPDPQDEAAERDRPVEPDPPIWG